MDKYKAAALLKENGLDAVNIDGVVMIKIPIEEYTKEISKARALIKDIGYEASWGFSVSDKNSVAMFDDESVC